jgi:hypothetical protein
MKASFAYALLDTSKPGTFRYGKFIFKYEPFYIGKGTGNRDLVHLSEKGDRYNTFKKRKITKLRKFGFEPSSIRIRINLSESAAFILEKILIRIIGRRDLKLGPLTNLTDGGDGGINPGPSVRKQISENSKRMHQNRTPKEKKRIADKSSTAIKETLSKRTKEKWNEVTTKATETKQNRSKKEKRLSSKRSSEAQKRTMADRSEERKLEIYSGRSKSYFSKPEKERKKLVQNRIDASWHNKTEKEKQSITNKRIDSGWRNKTDKEKAEIVAKANASRAITRLRKLALN